MIFTHHNVARRCDVFDVDAGTRLDDVERVDTAAGELPCISRPVRSNHLGEIETFALQFAAIHPIYGGGPVPEMFHCYGRKAGG